MERLAKPVGITCLVLGALQLMAGDLPMGLTGCALGALLLWGISR